MPTGCTDRVMEKHALDPLDNGPDVRQSYKSSSGVGLFFLDPSNKL